MEEWNQRKYLTAPPLRSLASSLPRLPSFLSHGPMHFFCLVKGTQDSFVSNVNPKIITDHQSGGSAGIIPIPKQIGCSSSCLEFNANFPMKTRLIQGDVSSQPAHTAHLLRMDPANIYSSWHHPIREALATCSYLNVNMLIKINSSH